MDQKTLQVYDANAATFAEDWEAQPPPIDMHHLIERHFEHGLTADIGCGGGRDTEWLCRHGYPAIGFDASEGLLAEAKRRRPQIEFRQSALPDLPGISPATFKDVLCETVIMHLETDVIEPSIRRLLQILQPSGILYLSWRTDEISNRRDDRGRLYNAFDPMIVLNAMKNEQILANEKSVSLSSNKALQRIVARKISR